MLVLKGKSFAKCFCWSTQRPALRAAGARRLMKLVAYYLKIKETSLSLQRNKIFIFQCMNVQKCMVVTFQLLCHMALKAKIFLMTLQGE